MLLFITLLVVLVLIALSAEAPRIATQLRRDREDELIHRGAQYARGIKKYYKKFGSYPVRLEQLEDSNHLRFLRKRYKDPMTGKDFRLLHFGEVNLMPKVPGMATGPGVAAGSGVTAMSALSGMMTGGATTTAGQPSSPFVSLAQMGAKGATFGGGPVIGVASTSDKQSLHVFNDKDHYKDWEFIYDPSSDRGGLIRGPYNGPPTFGGGTVPGAVTPGQMQPGTSPFGQTPVTQPSPFGGPQPQTSSPFGTPQR